MSIEIQLYILMKYRFTSLFVSVFLLVSTQTQAQQKTVSGTVRDENGQPLIGVNIIVMGTDRGASTDFDGKYAIEANPGQSLKFTYIGYQPKVVQVNAATVLNVSLIPTAQQLKEVVISALGISREKKSLGYATQEIKADEVSAANTDNFINSLSGRAAGLQIRRTNNMGGSTNIVIRGNTSLTGDNQALLVIDGVPISNLNTNNISQITGTSGSGYD